MTSMTKLLISRLLYTVALLLASNVLASPAAEKISAVMSVPALEGNFQQQVIDADGLQTDSAAGRFFYAAPGRFRWDYETPYQQLIVADGSMVWIYDKELEQVTRRAQTTQASNDPMSLLSQPQALDQVFSSRIESRHGDTQRVLLTAKDSEAQIRSVVVQLRHDQLASLTVIDSFGQRTRFSFSQLVVKSKLAAGLFRFVPPVGVEVVDAMLSSGDSTN